MIDLNAMIDAMEAAGLSPEKIVEVLRRVTVNSVTERDASRDASVTERDARAREMAAERARRYRKSKRNSDASGACMPASVGSPVTVESVTRHVTERDGACLVSPAPLPLILEQTVEEDVLKKEVKRTVNARARGSRLPADFVPDAACEAKARELGFSQRDWDLCLEEFKNYWTDVPGAKGVKLSWQGTYRNAIQRYAEMRKGRTNGHKTGAIADAWNQVDAVFAERDRRKGGQGNREKDAGGLPGLWESAAALPDRNN